MRHIPFTTEQSDVLLGTSRAMRIAAGLTIAKAVFDFGKAVVEALAKPGGESMAGYVAAGFQGCLGGVLAGAFAFMLFKAGAALDAVVHTDVDDQGQLAEAIRQLRNVFLLKLLTMVLGILLGCLLGVGVAMMQ